MIDRVIDSSLGRGRGMAILSGRDTAGGNGNLASGGASVTGRERSAGDLPVYVGVAHATLRRQDESR